MFKMKLAPHATTRELYGSHEDWSKDASDGLEQFIPEPSANGPVALMIEVAAGSTAEFILNRFIVPFWTAPTDVAQD